ncbi:hypothetical protein AB1Y20_017389 [Prymnesium parvum]|uniref:Uncharacterized protein n=1 Tax=Prymnesium parvum TaxID=97485 RepID=A0AB34JP86_PRYPA
MAEGIVWGRGAGEGIGLSGHKNEYQPGVRIGNWVEEQFGREAPLTADSLKNFMKAREDARIASYVPPEPNKRVEPYLGVPATMLFSHGKEHGSRFLASMSALHYTDPSGREYGAKSNDRVHRTYYWGTKHIDYMVPQNDPNPRHLLSDSKRAQWDAEKGPAVPVSRAVYLAESLKTLR